MKNERLKEFYSKIHDSKGTTPQYISIIIRPGKNLIDFKIKKEGGESNILKIIAHDEKASGWFVHSYHIPFKNLGLPTESKTKDVLALLNEPKRITRDKTTKELLEEIQRKYIEIQPDKKNLFFKTKRFKKKKELQTGTKLKGM